MKSAGRDFVVGAALGVAGGGLYRSLRGVHYGVRIATMSSFGMKSYAIKTALSGRRPTARGFMMGASNGIISEKNHAISVYKLYKRGGKTAARRYIKRYYR